MASALQQAVTSIQMKDFATRKLVNLSASCILTLMLFPVVMLSAVGYDYSR